jgi:hypothetical protein
MKKLSLFLENLSKQSAILDLGFGIWDCEMLTPSGFQLCHLQSQNLGI